jgi:hypothetical protein
MIFPLFIMLVHPIFKIKTLDLFRVMIKNSHPIKQKRDFVYFKKKRLIKFAGRIIAVYFKNHWESMKVHRREYGDFDNKYIDTYNNHWILRF